MTLQRSVPGLALIVLLLVGCPDSEDEERQAAALVFLSSPPTPSSIEVLQPQAAEKLAEVEPELADDTMRENLVAALVLIDDEASHQLLVQVLIAEPQRVSTAFDTARQYGKLGNQLAVLYDQLDDVSRTAAFLDVCWPAYVDDDDAALTETCGRLWAASEGETQSRWMRQFTHVGPSDDPAPFQRLREGVATDRSAELDEIVLRVGGGDVIPAKPAARKMLRLSTKLDERRARYSREATGASVVPVEGGFVELIPPDPGTDFGRVANQLLADVPLSCAGAWGGTASDRSRAVLEVVLHGTRQPPTVRVVPAGTKKKRGTAATAVDGEAETPATPEETLRACFEQGLAATHGGGSAPWVPRSGTCRLTLNFQRGSAPWTKNDEGRVLLADEDLRLMGERLRDSGTAGGQTALDLGEHDPAPLRDLGSMDLGFCVAYVDHGWTDCAVWLGEVATTDEPLQAALRRGLRDVEPAVRTLCRTALAVQLDEEALDEAAKPPEPEEPSGSAGESGEPSAGAPAAAGEATGS